MQSNSVSKCLERIHSKIGVIHKPDCNTEEQNSQYRHAKSLIKRLSLLLLLIIRFPYRLCCLLYLVSLQYLDSFAPGTLYLDLTADGNDTPVTVPTGMRFLEGNNIAHFILIQKELSGHISSSTYQEQLADFRRSP